MIFYPNQRTSRYSHHVWSTTHNVRVTNLDTPVPPQNCTIFSLEKLFYTLLHHPTQALLLHERPVYLTDPVHPSILCTPPPFLWPTRAPGLNATKPDPISRSKSNNLADSSANTKATHLRDLQCHSYDRCAAEGVAARRGRYKVSSQSSNLAGVRFAIGFQ